MVSTAEVSSTSVLSNSCPMNGMVYLRIPTSSVRKKNGAPTRRYVHEDLVDTLRQSPHSYEVPDVDMKDGWETTEHELLDALREAGIEEVVAYNERELNGSELHGGVLLEESDIPFQYVRHVFFENPTGLGNGAYKQLFSEAEKRVKEALKRYGVEFSIPSDVDAERGRISYRLEHNLKEGDFHDLTVLAALVDLPYHLAKIYGPIRSINGEQGGLDELINEKLHR